MDDGAALRRVGSAEEVDEEEDGSSWDGIEDPGAYVPETEAAPLPDHLEEEEEEEEEQEQEQEQGPGADAYQSVVAGSEEDAPSPEGTTDDYGTSDDISTREYAVASAGGADAPVPYQDGDSFLPFPTEEVMRRVLEGLLEDLFQPDGPVDRRARAIAQEMIEGMMLILDPPALPFKEPEQQERSQASFGGRRGLLTSESVLQSAQELEPVRPPVVVILAHPPAHPPHETLKIERIRRQLLLKRPAIRPATTVASSPTIAPQYVDHEPARIKRLRRQEVLSSIYRTRMKEAAEAAAALLSQPAAQKRPSIAMSVARVMRRPSFKGSLVLKYLNHVMPIARAGASEALLHYSAMKALGPIVLYKELVEADAAARPTRGGGVLSKPIPVRKASVVGVQAPAQGDAASSAVAARRPSQVSTEAPRRPYQLDQQDPNAASTPTTAALGTSDPASNRRASGVAASPSGDRSRSPSQAAISPSSIAERRRSSATASPSSGGAAPRLSQAKVTVTGAATDYLHVLLHSTPTDRINRYRFRTLEDHHLSHEPVAFLLGLTTKPCRRLRGAAQRFNALNDQESAAKLRIVVGAYTKLRTARLSSALRALAFLAVSDENHLVGIPTRLAMYLTADDCHRLAATSRSLCSLSRLLQRMQASSTRVQCKARQRQARMRVQIKREQRRAAVLIQTAFRGHFHGRQRVYRLALRETRRNTLGMDADMAELMVTGRRFFDVRARLEVTKCVCLKVQSLAESPASARALIDMGFLVDLTDQLKDQATMPHELLDMIVQALDTLLQGVAAPTPFFSRGHVVRSVLSLLASDHAAEIRTACSFLYHLSPDRCQAFPGAYAEAGALDMLLDLLEEPLEPGPFLADCFPMDLVDRVKQWAVSCHAILNFLHHDDDARRFSSLAGRCPPPLAVLLGTIKANLWLLDLCRTSAALRLKYRPPQIHHVRATCLDTARVLNNLLVQLLQATSYHFMDTPVDADLIMVLDKLLRLTGNAEAHETSMRIATQLCRDPRARNFMVECSIIESVQGLLEEYQQGGLRKATENVVKSLTDTILLRAGKEEAEEEGGVEEAPAASSLSAAGEVGSGGDKVMTTRARDKKEKMQAVEQKALQGIYKSLVE